MSWEEAVMGNKRCMRIRGCADTYISYRQRRSIVAVEEPLALRVPLAVAFVALTVRLVVPSL